MMQRSRRSRALSVVAISGGAVLALGLTADWIGLGSAGFDSEQLLVVAAGLLLLLTGLLGQRAAALYRIAAFNFLNLLLMLFCLEVASLAMLRAGKLLSKLKRQADVTTVGASLSTYHSQEWAAQHWDELFEIMKTSKYRAWVHWDQRPFDGETVHIDRNGIRRTPGAHCDLDSYRIFTFGGSTMWGFGAPDWGTIAAYLQSSLQVSSDRPVCVMNFGELGYVSTQSLIQLLMERQSGNVPNLAIFYDGIADVMAAHQTGDSGTHIDQPRAAEKHERASAAADRLKLLRMSNLFLLLETWARPEPQGYNYRTLGRNVDTVADAITEVYLGNYEIVDKLAGEYGFDHIFFWQPVISLGEKHLTEIEHPMRARLTKAFVDLTDTALTRVSRAADERENLHVIIDVFDQRTDSIWLDPFHVTPVGNQLVAQAMLPKIRDKQQRFFTGD